jgi:hypothetical protein
VRDLQRITHFGCSPLEATGAAIPLVLSGEGHFRGPCDAGGLEFEKRSRYAPNHVAINLVEGQRLLVGWMATHGLRRIFRMCPQYSHKSHIPSGWNSANIAVLAVGSLIGMQRGRNID